LAKTEEKNSDSIIEPPTKVFWYHYLNGGQLLNGEDL
jgi:hypothetical protein